MHFHNRADFQKHDGSMPVGKRSNPALSPTIREEKTVSYAVKTGDKTIHCKTITEVNQYLAVNPTARVVKTTKTVTTTVTHKRIR